MTNLVDFRTCPTTGLGVDRAAERLIKANAVVAVVFLAIGGFFVAVVGSLRSSYVTGPARAKRPAPPPLPVR